MEESALAIALFLVGPAFTARLFFIGAAGDLCGARAWTSDFITVGPLLPLGGLLLSFILLPVGKAFAAIFFSLIGRLAEIGASRASFFNFVSADNFSFFVLSIVIKAGFLGPVFSAGLLALVIPLESEGATQPSSASLSKFIASVLLGSPFCWERSSEAPSFTEYVDVALPFELVSLSTKFDFDELFDKSYGFVSFVLSSKFVLCVGVLALLDIPFCSIESTCVGTSPLLSPLTVLKRGSSDVISAEGLTGEPSPVADGRGGDTSRLSDGEGALALDHSLSAGFTFMISI
jgi:hypothetical protein